MSIAELEQAIRAGARVLVDTSGLIAYLNGGEATTPVAVWVIDQLIQSGRNPGIVSMVSVMEVLVRPLQVGAPGPYQHLQDFLTCFPNLTAAPVELAVAQEAGSLRAMFRLATPDALIVATGLVSQVHHLVTDDAEWIRKLQPLQGRIRVCLLGQFV